MKKALFIGRFQPFHIGHASVFHTMQQDGIEHVIIGIGSSQYSRTTENPFTFEERKHMIEAALADEKNIPTFEIIAIEDIHNPPEWVEHVDRVVGKTYDVVYSGNPFVQQLFRESQKNVHPVHISIPIDGTTIRQHIVQGDEYWKQFVHPAVAAYIDTQIL